MPVEVLKFASSILRTARDLPIAVDEVYRRWRSGCRVLAVVSAVDGVTDQLMDKASDLPGSACPEATAAYAATGEEKTAALLVGALLAAGIPSRMVEPRELCLLARGSSLESVPAHIDAAVLETFWSSHPVLVLPGFYDIDVEGSAALFDRGGSVGHPHDRWAVRAPRAPRLKIALLGLGVVGRGVYERARLYPQRFDIVHVVVRDVSKYPGVDGITTDHSVALDESIDIVIVCIGGIDTAYRVIADSLAAGKFVITANKAAVAAYPALLSQGKRGNDRRFWYSACVGGAVPAIEALAALASPVREIRGIVNGTCGFVLDAREKGHTLATAVAMAQAAGFAEADPSRDLSGRDSADKLALLIEAAFGEWIAPHDIVTVGIDAILGDARGHKLIARARRSKLGIEASVQPEIPAAGSFLGQAQGAENRLEITLTNGEVVRLRGQGAGRWPTAVSVLGDLHEAARQIDAMRELA